MADKMFNIYRITNGAAKTRGIHNQFVAHSKRARQYFITAQSANEALDFAMKTSLFPGAKREDLDQELYRVNVQPLRFHDEPKAQLEGKIEAKEAA